MRSLMITKLFLALSSLAILAVAGVYADRRGEAPAMTMAGAPPVRWLVEPVTSGAEHAVWLASMRDKRS